MSKNQIRKDKTCLNCHHVVDLRYCPNCGQENSDTRKTFHHLFVHFFEDLTHYENAFWKTIRNLLFKPAALTKEYLSGKRLSYLAPVRLYIFISFVTFLVIASTAGIEEEFEEKPLREIMPKKTDSLTKNEKLQIAEIQGVFQKQSRIDSLRRAGLFTKDEADGMKTGLEKQFRSVKTDVFGYHSLKELDSVQNALPEGKKMGTVKYWFYKKMTRINQSGMTGEEMARKFMESFLHNFPKVLFIYMPIFALMLWLFHDKKRWYYFDHGIFTLHYFSFLLLLTLVILGFSWLLSFWQSGISVLIAGIINAVLGVWMVYYFFPAHHRFYGETRTVSFLKSVALFFINLFLMAILLGAFTLYTFVNLH